MANQTTSGIHDRDGSIGIGTIAPLGVLHVHGTSTEQVLITYSGNQRMLIGRAADYGWLQPYTNGVSYDNLILARDGGYVGIGTTNPQSKLHVARAGNANGGTLLLGLGGSGANKWSYLAGAHYNQATGAGNGVGSAGVSLIGSFSDATDNNVFIGGGVYEINPATSIRFHTYTTNTQALGGIERMRITSAGNVGIGIDPSYVFDVLNNSTRFSFATGNGNAIFYMDGANGDLAGGDYTSMTSDGSGNFNIATGNAERLRIEKLGNVGIGIDTPTAKLHVSGSSQNTIAVDSGAYPEITFRVGGAIKSYDAIVTSATGFFTTSAVGDRIYRTEAGNHLFGYGSTELMRINYGGNVGIGTASPIADGLTIRREGGDRRVLLKLDRPNTAGLQTALQFTVSDIMVGQIQHEYAASNYNHMSFTLRAVNGSDIIPLWLENSGNVGIGTTGPVAKLDVYQSGSTALNVAGSQGQLFSVTDSLSGSLMSVNDISGVPILEVFSDDRVVAGTFGSNALVVNGGSVGIGTATPSYNFQVTETTYARVSLHQSTTGALWQWGNDGSNLYAYYDNTAARVLDLQQNGNVGIGSASPAYKLDVTGTIRATGDVIAYSDRRVKQDIVTLENSVELIQKLRGVSYKKIGESEEKIGVIAQEILEVLPQVVSKDENGMYSVAYGNMAGLFIEAIKQQQAHIDTLEQRIEKLEQLLTQKP